MNVQLRHSLAWQMVGPIPLTVIAAIARYGSLFRA